MDERETLQRARNLLICEIAEIMNETKGAAEARLDLVTNPDKKTIKNPESGSRFNRGRKSG
jgi:hypothetical protein